MATGGPVLSFAGGIGLTLLPWGGGHSALLGSFYGQIPFHPCSWCGARGGDGLKFLGLLSFPCPAARNPERWRRYFLAGLWAPAWPPVPAFGLAASPCTNPPGALLVRFGLGQPTGPSP